jgi:hypothetical protein
VSVQIEEVSDRYGAFVLSHQQPATASYEYKVQVKTTHADEGNCRNQWPSDDDLDRDNKEK